MCLSPTRRFWAWMRSKARRLIFPVVFKTLATKQYAPVREFRRRVRLALEENKHAARRSQPGLQFICR